MLPPHRLCSLNFLGKPVPKDFLKLVGGEVATPEQSTAFGVVLVSETTSVLWTSRHANMFPASSTRLVHTHESSPLCMRRFSNLASHRSCWAAPLGSNQVSTTFQSLLGDPACKVLPARRAKTALSTYMTQARVASLFSRAECRCCSSLGMTRCYRRALGQLLGN